MTKFEFLSSKPTKPCPWRQVPKTLAMEQVDQSSCRSCPPVQTLDALADVKAVFCFFAQHGFLWVYRASGLKSRDEDSGHKRWGWKCQVSFWHQSQKDPGLKQKATFEESSEQAPKDVHNIKTSLSQSDIQFLEPCIRTTVPRLDDTINKHSVIVTQVAVFLRV